MSVIKLKKLEAFLDSQTKIQRETSHIWHTVGISLVVNYGNQKIASSKSFKYRHGSWEKQTDI